MHKARQLRSEMSVSEKLLWSYLRREQLGFKFRRQVAVGPYVIDFYCPEASLGVEVDGEQHQERTAYDFERDERLKSKGIEIIRIKSQDIFALPDRLGPWLKLIQEACEKRSRRQALP